MPKEIEVCLVQLPGREGRLREKLFTSIQPLAKQLVAEIHPLLDRPFALYGHSLGATIAFEVARALRRGDFRQPEGFPVRLFVGASPAPQLAWRHSLLRDLAESDFISMLESRYAEMPKVVMDDPQMRALLMPVLRADVAMVETYQYSPEPPLACGITAYGGTQDQAVMREELDAWREQTSADFRVHMLEGNHFFLQTQRADLLKSLAAELHALINRREAGDDRSFRAAGDKP